MSVDFNMEEECLLRHDLADLQWIFWLKTWWRRSLRPPYFWNSFHSWNSRTLGRFRKCHQNPEIHKVVSHWLNYLFKSFQQTHRSVYSTDDTSPSRGCKLQQLLKTFRYGTRTATIPSVVTAIISDPLMEQGNLLSESVPATGSSPTAAQHHSPEREVATLKDDFTWADKRPVSVPRGGVGTLFL